MQVHNPETKIGAGSGSGGIKTVSGLVGGGLGSLVKPVYVCVAVICCPTINLVVSGTQIRPLQGFGVVAVPTGGVLGVGLGML
jgi:hypothetical protein